MNHRYWRSVGLSILFIFLFINITSVFAAPPNVSGSSPANGATNVFRDVSISLNVVLAGPGLGVDSDSLNSNTVYLYRTADGPSVKVPTSSINTSGGGDTISLVPAVLLDANTNYTFVLTSGVTDVAGNPFEPFTMSFTTGTGGTPPPTTIEFTKTAQGGASNASWATLDIGPDNRLYAVSLSGRVARWDIQPDGTLTNETTLYTFNPARAIIGLAFDPASTPSNPILWLTHNDGNLGASFKHFTGALSKLTFNGSTWVNRDYAVGFPRSVRDHMTNSLAFGPDGALYLVQGSISAAGDLDNAWGQQPETVLSAAILRIDTAKLEALGSALPLNVATGIPSADGRLNAPNNYGLNTPELAAMYDPMAPNAPITLYATGVRNAYDIVWHSNGWLYAPTNGTAAGGRAPATPSTLPPACQTRIDSAINGPYTGPTVPAAVNIETQMDYLYKIEEGGYYGHPNPTRCEWVLNGGNPTAGADPGQVNAYPVGVQVDRNFRGFTFDFGSKKSPNGVIEYRSNTFGGALRGKLLVVRYSEKDDILVLTPGANGDIVSEQFGIPGFTGFTNPLDLTEDTRNGNIYVIELLSHTQSRITLLKPAQLGTPEISVTPTQLAFGQTIGGGASPAQSVTISNSGTQPLSISGLSIVGADAADFVWGPGMPPTLPFTLNPSETRAISVAFDPSTVGTKQAILRINSNDPNRTIVDVPLSGQATNGTGGNNEPSLQAILNAHNIPVNVGDDDVTTTTIHSSVPTNLILGEEVLIPRFQKASSGPVTIQVLAAYGLDFNPVVTFGTYTAGNANSRVPLFTVNQSTPSNPLNHQTLNPLITGTTIFNPAPNDIFGFYTWWQHPTFGGNRLVYTEDTLNTFQPSQPHHARVYPNRRSDGSIIPNSYIIGWEEFTSGWDFNDIVVVVNNVKLPGATGGGGGGIDFENRDWITLNGIGVPGMEYVNRWLSMSRIHIKGFNATQLAQWGSIVDHDTVTLRIHNRSNTNPLTISNLVINQGGPWFTLPNGETSLTIGPNGFYDLQVKFIDANGANYVIPRQAQLVVYSDDPANPVSNITLAGIYQYFPETVNEPEPTQFRDVFGMTQNMGAIDGGVGGAANPNSPVGEEVISKFWRQLDPNKPVYVRQLAAYHGCCTQQERFRVEGSINREFRHSGPTGNAIFPLLSTNNSSPAEITFSTGGQFSFRVGNNYVSCDGACPSGHAIRTWPVRGPNGQIIPGVFLIAHDYVGGGANYDYQDNMYIITNVEPVSANVNLQLSGTDTPDPVDTGAQLTYTFSIFNNSIFSASNTNFTATLPSGATIISAVSTQGTCTGTGPITCDLGIVNGGETETVTITIVPNTSGTITAVGTVTTTSNEISPANNTVTLNTLVRLTTPGSITIVKQATPEGAQGFDFTGSLGNFTLTDDGSTQPNNFFAQINFERPIDTTPSGWIKDSGGAYGTRANGQTYGWLNEADDQPIDASLNTRNRFTGGTPQQNTFILMQYPDCCTGQTNGVQAYLYWEHALPNGRYRVTVGVGDANAIDSTHVIRAEGQLVVNFAPSTTGPRFAEGTVTVDVTDGRLTLDAIGGTNTKINYVVIDGVDIVPNQRLFDNLTPGTYNFSEIVPPGWTLTNASCVGGSFSTIPNGVSVNLSLGQSVTCTFRNTADDAPPTAMDDSASMADTNTTVTFNILANDSDIDGTVNPNSVDLDPDTAGDQTSFTVAGQGTYTYNPATGEVTFTRDSNFTGISTIRYTVRDNDNNLSNFANITVTVIPTVCSPYTTELCSTIPVNITPNYCLTWDSGPAGGLAGTGFTMVDPPSVHFDPPTPSNPAVPGFEPSYLSISGGQLVINATRGLQYERPPKSTNNNTQVNALGVGFNAASYPIRITTTIVNPNIPGGNNSQQAGIWFGLDEDNYVKLVVLRGTSANTGNIQILKEDYTTDPVNGLVDPTTVGPIANLSSQRITLILDLNPSTGQAIGRYSLDGGTTVVNVGTKTIPSAFFSGQILPDGTSGPVSFGGLFASARNYTGGVIPFAFDDFCIQPTVNLPPVAGNDNVTTAQDTPVTINFIANDVNPDGPAVDPNTIDLDTVAAGQQTTRTVGGQGTFTYDSVTQQVTFTPVAGFSGLASVRYTVTDDLGAVSNEATINVSINSAPIATNDSAVTSVDTPVDINILFNDVDPDGSLDVNSVDLNPSASGQQLAFTIVDQGTYVYNPSTGLVTFTPVAGFTGTSSARYTIQDNTARLSNEATITVRINVSPVANDDNATTLANTPVTFNIVANDTDADGTVNNNSVDLDLATSGIQTSRTVTGEGTFTYSNATGAVTFTPEAGFVGVSGIQYTITDNDGALSNPARIEVIVNDGTNVCTPIYRVNAGGGQIAALDAPYGNWIANTGNGAQGYVNTGNTSTAAGSVTITLHSSVPAYVPPQLFRTNRYDPASNPEMQWNIPVTSGQYIVNLFFHDHYTGTNQPGRRVFNVLIEGVTVLQNYDVVADVGWATGVMKTFTVNVDNNLDIDFQHVIENPFVTAIEVRPAVCISNNPPVANDDTATTTINTPVTINFAANDSDAQDGAINPDTIDLNPALAGQQTNFAVSGQGVFNYDAGSDTLTFTPEPNYGGTVVAEYIIRDSAGVQSNVATITVQITGGNTAPVAVNDAVSTDENVPVTINFAANDSDAEDGAINPDTIDLNPALAGQQTTATIPGVGTFNYDSVNDTLTFTPVPNFDGVTTINYVVSDSGGFFSNVATITVTVNAVNTAPVANNDTATTEALVPVTIDFIANDTDAEDTTLNPDGVDLDPATAGQQLTFVISGQGTFSYDAGTDTLTFTPEVTYAGDVILNYIILDSGGLSSNVATITVTVTAANYPPTANDDSATTSQGIAVGIDFAANDSDTEDATINPDTIDLDPATAGQQLSFAIPTEGSFNYDATTDTLTFTPEAGFIGQIVILYTVTDSGGKVSNAANITVDVLANASPVANNDTATSQQNTPVTINFIVNDTDVEDGSVNPDTIDLDPATAGQQTSFTVSGQGVFSYDDTTDTLTFTPDAAFVGDATASYTVTDADGATSNVATITVTVTRVNVPPVAADDSANTLQNVTVTIDFVSNDSDAEDGAINPDTIDLDPATAGQQTSFTVSGQGVFSYDATTDTLTFTPDAAYTGLVAISYTISDSGGRSSNTATITVTVATTNPAISIVISPATQTVNNGGTATFTITVANTGNIDLSNVTVVTNAPASGTTTCNNVIATLPAAGQPGAIVTYNCQDTAVDTSFVQKTANVIGTPINGAPDVNASATADIVVVNGPVANDDSASTLENTPIIINVAANDTDADNNLDLTSVVTTSAPSNGTTTDNGDGTITYTPAAGFLGVDSFDYEICDTTSLCASAAVTVSVATGPQPPVANDDTATTTQDTPVVVDVIANDTDANNNINSASVTTVTAPTNGTTTDNGDGTITYTPATGYSGSDSFTYQVCDTDGQCDTATVTVDIQDVNDPPIAVDDSATTNEDTPVNITVISNDSDPDGDTITLNTISLPPANGTATIGAGGVITYLPAANFNGTDSFQYTICDPSVLCAAATVTVTINPVPDAPVATNDGVNTPMDTPVTINVQGNDYDPDGDALTTTSADPNSVFLGTVVINGDGTITYTPPTGFTGGDSFSYQICDPSGQCATSVVIINVGVANEPPIAEDDTANTKVGVPVIILVQDNDSDPNGDTLITAGVTSGPTNGTTAIVAGGSIRYTPNVGFTGTDTFVYEICDGGGLCDTATVTVNVSADIFDPPLSRKTVDERGNQQLEWTFFWLNPNTQPVNARVTDPVPSGLTFVAGSLECEARGAQTTTTSCQMIGNEAVWEGVLGPAPGFTTLAGAPNALIIRFRTDIPAGVNNAQNQASATYDSDNNGSLNATATSNIARWQRGGAPANPTPDPTTGDAAADTPPVVSPSGLSINKSVNPATATAGDTVTFIITITNGGTGVVNNVFIEDNIPADFAIVSANASGGAVSVNGQTVALSLPLIQPAETVTINIQARVVNNSGAYISINTACVSDASGQQVCDSAQVLGVTQLPRTGESPWSKWRPLIFLIGGLFIATVLVIGTRAMWRRNRL